MDPQSNISRKYIYDLVKKIDLSAFIEREVGIKFSHHGGRWSCRCPMPHHRDKTPSFGVSKLPDDVWVFGCFGCGSKGTIVDFCMEYWTLDTSGDALALIADKMNLGSAEEIIKDAIKHLKVSVDEQKALEVQHISASDGCREILRRYPGRTDIEGWVATKYRAMNQWLLDGNEYEIRMVRSYATHILEKGVIPYGG